MTWEPLKPRTIGNRAATQAPCSATIIAAAGRASRLAITFRSSIAWLSPDATVSALLGTQTHGGLIRITRGGEFILRKSPHVALRAGHAVLTITEPMGVLRERRPATSCEFDVDGEAIVVTLPRGWSKLEGGRNIVAPNSLPFRLGDAARRSAS